MNLLKLIKMMLNRKPKHFELVKFSDCGPSIIATPELVAGWYVDSEGIIKRGEA
jgi:hypothetical protein